MVESDASYLVLVAVGTIDIWLLYRFFSGAQGGPAETFERHLGGIPSGPVDHRRASLLQRGNQPAQVEHRHHPKLRS